MSQNDFVIANQTAPNFRADLNLALQALASNSSGATTPSTTYANMLWYDTATNILKMRSEADDAWINLGTLDQSANTFAPAGVAELTQVQAEDDTSTVFGQVSGQRLGQAVAANVNYPDNAIGVGQTWQSVSRSASTSYQNTTGKPIEVAMSINGNLRRVQVSSNNSTWVSVGYSGQNAEFVSISFIVPDTWYYRINGSVVGIQSWSELR